MIETTVIGVLSDTHATDPGRVLTPALLHGLAGVDLILHAGDIGSLAVVEALEAIAPLYAVAGNMDPLEVEERLPRKRVLKVEGLSLGLIHGWGPPWNIRQRIAGEFQDVQVVIYGHTHQAHAGYEGGVYYFNPGALGGSRLLGGPSWGRLTIGESIRGEIIRL